MTNKQTETTTKTQTNLLTKKIDRDNYRKRLTIKFYSSGPNRSKTEDIQRGG